MTTNHAKTFSESLRNVIQVREMSQKQFAIQLDYGAQYLSDILLGKRTPSVRFVNAVCDLLRLGPHHYHHNFYNHIHIANSLD